MENIKTSQFESEESLKSNNEEGEGLDITPEEFISEIKTAETGFLEESAHITESLNDVGLDSEGLEEAKSRFNILEKLNKINDEAKRVFLKAREQIKELMSSKEGEKNEFIENLKNEIKNSKFSYIMDSGKQNLELLSRSDVSNRLKLFDKYNNDLYGIVDAINSISAESISLAENNNYFQIKASYPPDQYDINLITENNLNDIHSFDPSLKELEVGDLVTYVHYIKDLKPEVKEFCKKVYEDGALENRFNFGSYQFYELIKDESKFQKLKKCFESGLYKDFKSSSFIERLTQIDDNQLDAIIETGEKDLTQYDHSTEVLITLDPKWLNKYKSLKSKFTEASEEAVFGIENRSEQRRNLIYCIESFKEMPEDKAEFVMAWVNDNYDFNSAMNLLFELNDIQMDNQYFYKLLEIYNNDKDLAQLIIKFPFKHNKAYAVLEDVRGIEKDPLDHFMNKGREYFFKNFNSIKDYLDKKSIPLEQEYLDSIFNKMLSNEKDIAVLFNKNEFPLSEEQINIVGVVRKISNSDSREMKNMAAELSTQIVRGGDISTIESRFKEIENIYVKNNIPFVGKQAKICETLNPEISTTGISSPQLQSMRSNNAKRLLIFKDLLSGSFNSLNSNLEQYLLLFNDGQQVLDKFETGATLTLEEEEKLKYFFKKVNALSENTRKVDKFNKFDLENKGLQENLEALRENFGVRDGQTIAKKFESTFLNRIGINNINDALIHFNEKRIAVSERNINTVVGGKIELSEVDLVKGISPDYFYSYLDRGIYSPEFIGAETSRAKDKAKASDLTPWDTDLAMVGKRSVEQVVTESMASGYGDVLLLVKDRGQFNKNVLGQPLLGDENKLELFKTTSDEHYGIRTGFGSTEIDALLVKDEILESTKSLDSLKFAIAQKGFYIPICDKEGNVIFTADDYNDYKKIFSGIDKFHGEGIDLSEGWKDSQFTESIKAYSQTNENLDKINKIKDELYSDIEDDLKSLGIELHKGRYDDSVVGAKIVDTGSTGRGAALDSGYDFDFVIKINDSDADKIGALAEKLKAKYPYDQDYESSGMRTFRFKSFEKDGNVIDLDISFVKKSDSEDLDANEAVAQKYDSIRKQYGEDRLLDVLTNVRFAKKELKNAGCYKKGLTGNGEQQGGLGGIGVENWILQNGGDAISAFRDFNKNAFQNGEIVSYGVFKNKYKVFSAGSNIRGGVSAENFVYNMDETGYKKMAELSKKFI